MGIWRLGPVIRTATVVSVLLLCFPACGASAQTFAWWITSTFVPRDSSIEGIPVKALNNGWRLASLAQESDLPAKAREPGESLQDHGFRFAVEADLDGDGRLERCVVGVYEEASAATGRFLLILSRENSRSPWHKRALFVSAGVAGFSAIAMRKGHLQWVTCLEGDSACEVRSRSGRYTLRCSSCC